MMNIRLKKLMREKNFILFVKKHDVLIFMNAGVNVRTATLMILGSVCTRACRFCAVKTGLPNELDLAEPERVADSVEIMNLKHVVITRSP